MIILLSVLLLGFNRKSRTNLRAVDNFHKSRQALNCAGAGLNIVIAALRDTSDIHTNKTLSNLFSGENDFDLGDGKCSVVVTEESGKLNVNLLKDKNGRLNRAAIDRLLRLIDLLNQQSAGQTHIGYGLVPSIIDWTDCDDEVSSLPFIKYENSGAESSYYEQLATPYICKNGPFDMTEELLLVKGVEPQIFGRIRDYMTVYGDGKVNINSASKLVIESLSEKMDAVLAQVIINRRKLKPFNSIEELRDVPGMTDSIYSSIRKTITVSPTDSYYRVTSQGSVDNCGRTVVAVLTRNTKTENVDVVLYEEYQ
jgi:general secretion pathway protein K